MLVYNLNFTLFHILDEIIILFLFKTVFKFSGKIIMDFTKII